MPDLTQFLMPERLEELRGLSRATIVHMVETGELPEFAGDPISVDDAIAMLDEWLETHKGALAGATSDFLFDLAINAAKGLFDRAAFDQSIAGLSPEGLAEIAAADSARAESLYQGYQLDRAAAAEAMATLHAIVRGAIASGLMALLSVS